MSVERVNPAELAAPSGFSHAVRVSAGTTIHLAGQTGMDASGHIVEGGLVLQFEQALANLMTALRAAGGQPSELVSLTIYVVDLPTYRRSAREIGAVWRRLVGTDYPATAAVGVASLWDSEALVELQAVAAVG